MAQRALVVGASKGIGRCFADALTDDGWQVIGMSRTPPADPNYQWRWESLDLDDSQGRIGRKIELALQPWDHALDLLILSGGKGAMLQHMQETEYRAVDLMTTNFFGPVAVFRACLRPLLRGNLPMVAFIGSTCATRPSPGLSLYRGSKAALHAFALNKAHELRNKVRIHVIAPGWVETPMTAELKADLHERIVERIPAGRFATPDEVVDFTGAILDDKHASIYEVHEMSEFTTDG